jgi:glycosyltransferase involved in cell wall biosynthesis
MNLSFIKYFIFSLNIYILIHYSNYFFFYANKLETNNLPVETYKIFKNNKTMIYLKNNIIKKFNLYIKKCLNYDFEYNYPLYDNPRISAIIPLYNAENFLKYSLSSIQNQIMKEIEIILIDDNSTDNTLRKVSDYMKKDKRIRLIKNKENRKILYSKSIGALNSNGKYIIQLDQDDIFIRDDVFNILYNEAEKNDLDLVQIRDIFNKNFSLLKHTRVNYPAKHFIKRELYNKTFPETQPNLKNQLFINGNIYLLWGLLIKTNIYKKAIYYLWPLIINYKFIYYEDYIITSKIVLLSKKYKYLNNFALIHLNHNNSAMVKYYDQFYSSVLILQNILFNYYIKDNPRDIQIIINYIKRYKKIYKISYNLYIKYFSYNIISVLNNEYITNKDKELIEKELNINPIHYKMWNSYKYFMNYTQFNSIYDYEKACCQNPLISNNNIIKPKISVIIYSLYYKHLEKTIFSIENQKNIDLEIILVYDNVLNKNTNIFIEYIKKKYKNIKYIFNNQTKGMLYSYSMGVLNTNGEYILILKTGETLANNDILNKLYYNIIYTNYDIFEFNLLINNKDNITENSLRLYRCQHIKSLIDFDYFKFNKNEIGFDQEKEVIANKLIKSSLFKKIIYRYKLNKIKTCINLYYDKIILFLLMKNRAKQKHLHIIGIIKYINIIRQIYSNNIFNNKKRESIFYINFLFENTNNTFKEKKIVIYEFYNLLSIIFNRFNTFKFTFFITGIIIKKIICKIL